MRVYTLINYYNRAYIATSRLNLHRLAKTCAMSLSLLFLVAPFEVLGSKFLWWTWHDSDPLVQVRLLGVPYVNLFYHLCFAAIFCFLYDIAKEYVMCRILYYPHTLNACYAS